MQRRRPRLGSSFALLLATATATATATLLACSSSSSTSASDPPAVSAPPAIDGAPSTVAVYDGRTTTLPLDVRTSDPSKLTVTVTSAAVEAEVVPPDPALPPSADGLWHGSLKLRPGYKIAAGGGASITLDLVDASAQHVTVPIALDVHKIGWQKRVTWSAINGPATREHGSFFYDSDAKAAYLFGGSGYHPQNQPIDDSWRLDLASGTWAKWAPTGDVPEAAGSRRVAQIPGTKKFYVFGGYTGFEATAKDDGSTYLADFGNAAHQFTKLTNVNGAPGRELHAVTYDPKGEQLVVFGGFADEPVQDALDDTWLVKFTGGTATWSQVVTPKSPSARYGMFSTYDAESQRFIVWSGAQFPVDDKDPINAAQDAWALDLAMSPPKWSKLAPTGTAPKGRRNGCSMPDPSGRRLFVYGGTSDGLTTEKGLFVLDLEPGHESWTQLDLPNAPPLRSSGFGFATAEGGTTCAFGNDATGYDDVAFLGYAEPPK